MGNNALADLKPLIAPAPVPWWPPAPGWWLLGIALAIALVSAVLWGWKRWRHHRGTRYQREALALLASITGEDPARQLQDIAVVLRRAAVSVWGRECASTLPWREIVVLHSNTGKNIPACFDETSLQLLGEHLYRQQQPTAADVQKLLAQSMQWLRTLPAVER